MGSSSGARLHARGLRNWLSKQLQPTGSCTIGVLHTARGAGKVTTGFQTTVMHTSNYSAPSQKHAVFSKPVVRLFAGKLDVDMEDGTDEDQDFGSDLDSDVDSDTDSDADGISDMECVKL